MSTSISLHAENVIWDHFLLFGFNSETFPFQLGSSYFDVLPSSIHIGDDSGQVSQAGDGEGHQQVNI